MKKEIINNYRIMVKGSTDEIRDLIKNIVANYSRHSHDYLNKELGGLEHIIELDNYTFGIHNRIYYNHDTFMYVPNCSSKEGQRFHYHHFKPIFDAAYKQTEDKYDKLRRHTSEGRDN